MSNSKCTPIRLVSFNKMIALRGEIRVFWGVVQYRDINYDINGIDIKHVSRIMAMHEPHSAYTKICILYTSNDMYIHDNYMREIVTNPTKITIKHICMHDSNGGIIALDFVWRNHGRNHEKSFFQPIQIH